MDKSKLVQILRNSIKINYKFRLIVGLYLRKSDFGPCEQQIQSLACVFPNLIGFFVFKSKFHYSSRAGWFEPRLGVSVTTHSGSGHVGSGRQCVSGS